MKNKILPEFDERGCLPKGIYSPSIEEFIERFVNIQSDVRQEIFNNYKIVSKLSLKTNSLLKHYVNGSYTTKKKNPGDIDVIIIFNGEHIDLIDRTEEYSKISDEYLMHSYKCHIFIGLEYSDEYPIMKEYHDKVNNTMLNWWKTHYINREQNIQDPIPKGLILFEAKELEKLRDGSIV